MNLRKFEREMMTRQSEWHIQYTRIETIKKLLIITVSYIGPRPNWFVRTFKFIRVRFFKGRLNVFLQLASELAGALTPTPQNIRINVR